jgi:hypothetical protein
MRERLRAVWLWATLPGSTAALRDFVAVFCLVQAAVRLIDGLLFALTETVLATHATYGVLQMTAGLWLLSTRWARGSVAGRMAAAYAAGLFVMLAVDLFGRNAASGAPALLFAWVLAAEARYAVADH